MVNLFFLTTQKSSSTLLAMVNLTAILLWRATPWSLDVVLGVAPKSHTHLWPNYELMAILGKASAFPL